MIAIVAGNKREADFLARAADLLPGSCFYVWNAYMLRGRPRGQLIITTGSYRNRPDLEEIEEEITAGGWQELVVDLDRLVRG